jgi:serine/threonine-protein kinase
MIGRIIKGKYKIYDEVGSGGFATVYLGRNLDTNEIVAIKVLSEQFLTHPSYVERFRREAGLAERLQHPNIVRTLDHGVENGMHFLVMEFVEGLTLDKMIERKGRLSVEETISYVEQTCAGLQAAYQADIVHRDIKPANLMITPDGSVKIMDFGIARMESMSTLTQSGVFMGTPRYISPEMAKGEGTDIRSDLYSLGLLAYEMLLGSPPFDGDNPWAVLRHQIESPPPSLGQARPDVPSWLEAIIMRAIAKDPANRFQTPANMLAALQERTATPGVYPATMPPGPAEDATMVSASGRDGGGRKGLIIALVGFAAVVALGLAALLALGRGGGEAEPTGTALVLVVTNTPADTPTPTVTEPSPTGTGPPPTESPSPEPTDTVPPTATPTALPTDTPQPTATWTPIPTQTPAPTATSAQQPTDTPQPTAIPTQAPTSTPQPEASPTSPPAAVLAGKIAYSVGGTLYVVDVKTKEPLFTVSSMRQPDFRGDGAELLADGLTNPATVVNINAKTGAIIREQAEFTDDYHPFWSPDGSRFTFDSKHHGLGGYTMLYTQALTNRKPNEPITLHSDGQQIRGHSTVWTDDDLIAFTGCDYWPGGTGGSRCGIYVMPSWSGRPTLSRSGNTDMRATDNHGGQLVFMSRETGNWEVFVMPNRGGEPRNLSQSPGSQDGLGTFSPDGKKVAFVSNRGGEWAIWVVNLNGSGMVKLIDLPGQPTGPPWFDDCISWGP